MSTVNLDRNILADIERTIRRFPDAERFQLHEHGQSGIGCLLDLKFDYEINGVKCVISIPLVDESMW